MTSIKQLITPQFFFKVLVPWLPLSQNFLVTYHVLILYNRVNFSIHMKVFPEVSRAFGGS